MTLFRKGLAALVACAALGLAAPTAFAQAKVIGGQAPTVPASGVCFGAVGATATCVDASNPLPVTNAAGATAANQTSVQGSKAAGTAAANSTLTGCVYSSSAPSLTNGQQVAVQCDAAGNVKVAPGTATAADKGGTITTGGTAQTAIAANPARRGWCIQNPSDATEVLYVRVGATATTTSGAQLAAGQQACNPPSITDTALISVIAATTGHRFFGTEWQ